jgi:CHASE3 domain sensor protein/GAF domain-containing protein
LEATIAMTTPVINPTPATSTQSWLPGSRFFKNLSIGAKLVIGFGILVILTLAMAAFSYLGSQGATAQIDNTGNVRVPTALASARAQANLLKMLGDVRGYLALGESDFRNEYERSRQAFEANLAELEQLSPNLNPENIERLEELKAAFAAWSDFPEELFILRDDQLEREPAYRLLATDGIRLGGRVLIGLNTMIDSQGRREPSAANIALLADMAKVQGSFAAMLSGLRGYVTTRNRIFRGEYEANRDVNQFDWQRLVSKRTALTEEQQQILDEISTKREQFLQLPEQMFKDLESDRWREDLYLFTTEVVPLTDKMQQLLADLTVDQQTLLQTGLNQGRVNLRTANRQTLTGGLVALVLGMGLAVVFRESIAGPVRRLTQVANQIRTGDLAAQAYIESRDEIGTLATTFNSMTGQLRQTLFQVSKEKKRADDLLGVVIPIGVDLTSEKNFNRLLEKMLLEAKAFCHADAGILYLRRADEKSLEYVTVSNTTLQLTLGGTTGQKIPFAALPLYHADGRPNHETIASHVAHTGQSFNIAGAEATQVEFSGPKIFGDNSSDYALNSHLTIPLKNSEDEVVGVIQLINAQNPDSGEVIAFDENLQQMMESFSSLAVAALEAYLREESLKQEIIQLRIEIDEVKRQKEVEQIVETEVFRDLQARARDLRQRNRRRRDE